MWNAENALTDQKNLPPEILEHRLILNKIMSLAGFVNYPFEYWHWSFGDMRYARGKDLVHAIYGVVSIENGITVLHEAPSIYGADSIKNYDIGIPQL